MDPDFAAAAAAIDPTRAGSAETSAASAAALIREVFPSCRRMNEYELLNKISEGTYGVVYRARVIKTGEIVALKKLKLEREKEGFPISALREINLLLRIDHPNILKVKEVVVGSSLDEICMVMEFLHNDLRSVLEVQSIPFLRAEIKCLLKQLVEAIAYMHEHYMMHRDLKTSNLLLNGGILKVCDFGLARFYGSPLKAYTQPVVTQWYRAPELLLGETLYTPAVDVWSVGCIFAEFLLREPLFRGRDEFDQVKIIGKPTPDDYAAMAARMPQARLERYKQVINKYHGGRLERMLQPVKDRVSPAGLALLRRMLAWNPTARITAAEALRHEYFSEHPPPADPASLPTYPSQGEGAPRPKRKWSLEEDLIRQAEEAKARAAAEKRFANTSRERHYE